MTLRVVYIVGKGRSGSTLLDDVLGTMPGTVATGEMRLLWDDAYGFGDGYTCTCGVSITECPVWGHAVRRVVGSALAEERVRSLERIRRRIEWWPYVPAQLVGRRGGDTVLYGRLMGQLYAGIAEATGATTIVDSSKWPAHVGLLGVVPDIEPWMIQLVRDPRAVAHSYRRHRHHPGQPPLPRFGGLHTAASWSVRNLTAEVVRASLPAGRTRLLRYEHFAARPRETVAELGAWLGIGGATGAFLDDRTIQLGPAHVMGGNPRRFDRGDVAIRDDDEWVDGADPARTTLVHALTAPLLARYGYTTTD